MSFTTARVNPFSLPLDDSTLSPKQVQLFEELTADIAQLWRSRTVLMPMEIDSEEPVAHEVSSSVVKPQQPLMLPVEMDIDRWSVSGKLAKKLAAERRAAYRKHGRAPPSAQPSAQPSSQPSFQPSSNNGPAQQRRRNKPQRNRKNHNHNQNRNGRNNQRPKQPASSQRSRAQGPDLFDEIS
ncbi:hypothetical protein BX600DRAFT_505715 [Xylariales sp. PMI_506]|nr:hypothetical protein BX600DRAFT_505715 [Xylariales sp. PMI_506]